MYKCNCCGSEFETPETERRSYEDYYGVADLFHGYHYFNVFVCPVCFSGDIEEVEEEEEECTEEN